MPVNLQLAASCLRDMPSVGQATHATTTANPTTHFQRHHHHATTSATSSSSGQEPDVSEWSGLLVNEQEVAVHPVQAVDICMASSSNSIELTPLWPKSGSPNQCMRGGWPADHKSKGGQRAPPPPPPPSLGPPAVPTKSKNQPPPAPPPLPLTSSREFMQRKQQQERRAHPEGGGGGGSENKGPAPQPPQSAITNQPLRPSSSVSRGLQVEEDDLIQFTNGQKVSLANGTSSAIVASSASVAQLKKQLRSRLSLDDDLDPEPEEEEEEDETASARTADEQMDYLEGLEPCPCYAKCCLDSIISLFCVTVLG